MLSAFNISKAYSTRTLFSGLTLNVDAGDRIALIGANGSGKTTLMDILAGDTPPDSGNISTRRDVSIGYLRQEPASFNGKPLLQEVLEANADVIELMEAVYAVLHVTTVMQPAYAVGGRRRKGRMSHVGGHS